VKPACTAWCPEIFAENLPSHAAEHVCTPSASAAGIRHAGMGRGFVTYPDRSVRPEKTSASRGADRHAAYNPLTSG
jgi:hypothetical protein